MAKVMVRNRIKKAQSAARDKSILQVLKEEHDKVKGLLAKALQEPERSEELFSVIYSDLEAHMSGEEQLFYPELEPEESLRAQVLEAYEEHNLGKILLNELEGMTSGDERWLAKLTVLREVIEHHVEEEERVIFPKAKKLLGRERELRIARQYLEEKPMLEEMPGIGVTEETEEI